MIGSAVFWESVLKNKKTRRALGGAHIPLTKVLWWLTASVNETIVKSRVAATTNMYRSDLTRCKIPRCMAYTIAEKAIQFRHPNYNPDWAQKLISLSMSRHLSTRNISKSMHAFLSNLANSRAPADRQIDKRIYLLLCQRQMALLSQRGRAMPHVCVVGFNSTKRRVESFIVSYVT